MIIALAPSPNGLFALMDNGQLFERVRDPKGFDTTGRGQDHWVWVEREGPDGPRGGGTSKTKKDD